VKSEEGVLELAGAIMSISPTGNASDDVEAPNLWIANH